MAAFFGTDHQATTLAPDALALYPRIVYFAEAPKVNAAQGYYLSRFVREHVTVALSGLGGDELFLGYDIYRYLWPGRWTIDSPASRLAAASRGPWTAWLRRPPRGRPAGRGARRAVELAASGGDPLRYYLTLRNGWDLGPAIAGELYAPAWRERLAMATRDAFAPFFDRPDLPLVEQVQWAEFRAKMVDDFLANEDRMSMASSLEVRVPLLDREIVELALSLPLAVKFEAGGPSPCCAMPWRPGCRGGSSPSPSGASPSIRTSSWQGPGRPVRARADPGLPGGTGNLPPRFVRSILDARPSPRLRWHYFMLWQILGLKLWQEIFVEGRSWQEIEEGSPGDEHRRPFLRLPPVRATGGAGRAGPGRAGCDPRVRRGRGYAGHNKHDGLNSPLLARLLGGSRPTRLVAIQPVIRSPVNLRRLLRVPGTRNPKGIALFAHALLDLHAAGPRVAGELEEAEALLDWLLAHPADGFRGLSWGYPYPGRTWASSRRGDSPTGW